MFEKGQIVEIEITDMSEQGQGIGRADGLTVFAPGTVVGDKAKVCLTKVKKRYAFGRVENIIEPSKWRVESVCRYAGECGGCPYYETSHEGQLAIKEKQVKDKLIRLGGLEDPDVEPIEALSEPFAYRNKAVMQISTGGNIKRKGGVIENLGPVAIGFNKLKSHDVVDCKECMLQTGTAMAAADAVRQFMTEDNITAYDEKWDQGLMRSMTVRTAFGTGEVMVLFHIHGKAIPNSAKLVGLLDEAVYAAGGSLESVIVDNGKDQMAIAGGKVIKEKMGKLDLEISPDSFYQVDPAMTVIMYDKVKEYAGLTGSENVLDLYCGVGSIGLWCADEAGFVLGIESVREAVLDANRNAVLNGIVNAGYICGKAEDELPKLQAEKPDDKPGRSDTDFSEKLRQTAQNADVVILDPPRAGCHTALIDSVAAIAPERIVYMSCDPATMARDVKTFTEKGYTFVKAAPFDNFAWTSHTECVALLKRISIV